MKNKRFTLIDLLIVLVVIAAGFVVSKVMTPKEVAPDGKVEFVVMASSVNNEVAKNLLPGDVAVLSHAQKTNVTVKDVKYKPSEVNVFDNQTKTYKKVLSNMESDVFVTVEANAKISDTAILSGDVFVRVGSEANLSSKNLAIEGYIVEILSEQK